MHFGTIHLTAIAFSAILFLMVSITDTASLIPAAPRFNPAINFFQYRSEWRRAEATAKHRFASLQNSSCNDMEFLQILDDLIAFVDMQTSEAKLWSGSHPLDQIRNEADTAIAHFCGLSWKITASRYIAQRLDMINAQELDEESRRFLYLARRDARRAGADLCKEDRMKYLAIRLQLEDLDRQFERSIAQDSGRVLVDAKVLKDLQEDLGDLDVDPFTGLVSIPATSEAAMTVLQNSPDDTTAERIYKAMYSVAPANEEVLQRMMEIRHQQAKLLGYGNYIDFALEVDPLFDATIVEKYLIGVSGQAEVYARAEAKALSDILRSEGRPLQAWNFLYAKEQLLKRRLQGIDLNDVRKFFPYKHVVPRLLGLLGEMLSLDFRKVEGVEIWHSSVLIYDGFERIIASDEGRRSGIDSRKTEEEEVHPRRAYGRIYLDLVDRPDKDDDPHTFLLQPGVPGTTLLTTICISGSYVLTEASSVDIDFLASLFRELGNAMHLLLAQNSKYHRFNHLDDESALHEIPGRVLEELLLQAGFLRKIAIDESGRSIPPEYLDALVMEGRIDDAMFMKEQALYSLICLDLHTNVDNHGRFQGDSMEIVERLHGSYGNFGHIEGTHMQHSFKPLVSPDCRYYTNVRNALIAKALSRKWPDDDANDIASVGYKFRKALLEFGPTKDARGAFEAVLAGAITPDVS